MADLAKGTATGTCTGTLIGIENLTGAFAADALTGRGGADRLDYNQACYSPPTSRDRITDFSRSQGDKIDFRDVDANARRDGVQDLTFIGRAAFTAVGQLHYYQSAGHTYIEANTSDATAGPELVIVLDHSIAMTGGDFLL